VPREPGAGLFFLFHCMEGFFLAPRARSGRSGWASSPALRPACACDRTGTDQRADPRCAPPSEKTLGRDPHAPTKSLLWPAGRISPPPSRSPRACFGFFALPECRLVSFLPWRSGRGVFNPPVPRLAAHSGARGSRTREPRRGDGGAGVCERRGAPMRIALSGRGRRSVRPRRLGRRKAAPGHRGTGKTEAIHAVKDQ
jgi:hypothetical protein